MKIARGALLARLTEASVGLSSKEEIEQSNNFIFHGDTLTTFNDEIMVRAKNPLGFDVSVNAQDFMGVLSKAPDDEVDIYLDGGELIVKGVKRKSGLKTAAAMPEWLAGDGVPMPEAWSKITEGAMSAMKSASRVCGDNDAEYLTTVVHVTPDRVEATDNFRLFRSQAATGFPDRVLVPAHSVGELESLEVTKVAIAQGWAHFKTASASVVSVRCSQEPYNLDVDVVLHMTDYEKITLPSNLQEMVERAEVFNTGEENSTVSFSIDNGKMHINSRKEGGWHEERKSIEYTGRALGFQITPKFLVDILKRTRDVMVDENRMKVVTGTTQFLVCLEVPSDGGKRGVDAAQIPF